MNFLTSNSYDNSISYNSKKNTIPYKGSYEAFGIYNTIFIYAYLEGIESIIDTVVIEFSNDNNNSLDGISTETYTFTNGSNQISILPRLKYFRINISSNITNYVIRKYNTYLSLNQILLTDNSGTLNVNISGGSSVSGNVNCYGSENQPLNQDTSGVLNVNVLATPTISGTLTISGNATMVGNKSLPVNQSDIDGTLYVSISGTPAVTISGTPAVTISGTPAVTISGTPAVTISGTPAVTISGTPVVTVSGMVFDNSGNLKVNLDNVNSNFLTQGGLRTYIVNDRTTPAYVTISGYVSETPVMYDAFGRFRTSQPFTLFDATNVNYQSNKFSSYISGTSYDLSGAVTYDITTSTVSLNCASVTSEVNATVIREGIYTCPYQPGKSLLIMNTFSMSTPVVGLTQRVGYYNNSHGVYFEANSSDLRFVIKKNTSTTTYISQIDWLSLKSGLDVTRTQIVWFDLEWLGVGTVRAGFVINGEFYICAKFDHANISLTTYMTSAQLAPRYEIINNLTTSYTLKQICSTVISEGGYQGTSVVRHVKTTSPISGSTPFTNIPLVMIKLNDTVSGTQNEGINGIVLPTQIDMLTYPNTGTNGNGNYYYELISVPQSSISGISGGTFTPYTSAYTNDNSSVMYWVNNTGTSAPGISISGISGALLINGGYVSSNSTIEFGGLTNFNTQIGRTLSGTNSNYYDSNIIALICTKLDDKNATLYAQLGWYEL